MEIANTTPHKSKSMFESLGMPQAYEFWVGEHPRARRGNSMLTARFHTCWLRRWHGMPNTVYESDDWISPPLNHWQLSTKLKLSKNGRGNHRESEGRSISSLECSYRPDRRMDKHTKCTFPMHHGKSPRPSSLNPNLCNLSVLYPKEWL